MSAAKTSADLRADLALFDLPVVVATHFASGEDTIFTVDTGDLSLGRVIRYLVDLVKPGLEVEFGKPWDIIDSINLGAITFQLNAAGKDFGFRYDDLGIKLPFIDLDSISVWSRSTGEGRRPSVDVQLYGSFFGISFQDKPLTWDALQQRPPAVPGTGAKVFDLQYLGLGQHVTLRDIERLNRVGLIIDALSRSYAKVDDDQTNPLNSVPALTYSDSAGWLAGIQFSVLDTFDLAAIWNLPALAGMRIGLRGERAKTLAGLEFEILYRQIATDLGLYSIELKLPDGLRRFQAGAATLALPIINLDIYTNGGFKIDLGYPADFDFSRSFSLEMMIGPFPASGALGVYFGELDERAADGLPQIVSGSFAPVIVAGLGVRLGLGKSVKIGVLDAGFFLGIQGLLEGVVAFYQPRLASEAGGLFYHVCGALKLSGHIYGRIDFRIVKAEVDIYAYIGAAFVMESYRETIVLFSAGVQVEIKIKINLGLFKITIAFAFNAQIQEKLAIGSNQATPWRLSSGDHPANYSIQRVGYRRLHNGTYVLNGAFAEIVSQRPQRQRLAASGRLALPDRTPFILYLNPFITVGFADDKPGAVEETIGTRRHFDAGAPRDVKLVAGFLVRTTPAAEETLSPFAAFSKAALRWALAEVRTLQQSVGFTAEQDTVSLSVLQFLFDDLNATDPHIPIDMNSLEDFCEEYIDLQILPNTAAPDPQQHQYAPFPMLPYMHLSTSDGYQVNFHDKSPCSLKYQRIISEYFDQIAARDNGEAVVEQQDAASLYDNPISMAGLIFVDTFKMILRYVIGAAIEAMELFPYPAADGQSLPQIAAAVGLEGDDAVGNIAAANLDAAELLHPGTRLYIVAAAHRITASRPSLRDLAIRLQWPLLKVARAVRQQTDLLDPSEAVRITVPNGRYLLQPNDTVAILEEKFQTGWQAIAAANPDFDWTAPPGLALPAGETIRLPAVDYRPCEKDSLQTIADLFGVSLAGIIAAADQPIRLQPQAIAQLGLRVLVQQDDSIQSVLDRYALPLNEFLLWAKDETNLLQVGTRMTLAAGGRYIIKRGDTLQSISAAFGLGIDQLLEANPDFAWKPWPHSRQMLPNGKVIQLPALQITVAVGDTLQQIANRAGFGDIAAMIADEIAKPELLAGLARLTLPAFRVAIQAGESISQVANQYGLDAFNLLMNNQVLPQKPPAWNEDDDYGFNVVQIPDCEFLPQAFFYRQLENAAEKPFDAAAPMLGRFLFHGLRLPNPGNYQFAPLPEEADTETETQRAPSDWPNIDLYPLYELTGQQWPAPIDPQEYQITIGFTAEDRMNWAGRQVDLKMATGADALDELTITLQKPEIDLIQAYRKRLEGGSYFDPGIISLNSYPAFQIVSKVYSCQPALQWAVPAAPNFLDPSPTASGLFEQETPAYSNIRIYPLSDGLRQAIGDQLKDRLYLQAMAERIDPRSGRIGKTAIANSGWATQCDLRIRQVFSAGAPGDARAGSYEIFAGDAQSIADLLSVIKYLRLDRVNDQVELRLLYRTDPGSDMPEGVRSDNLAGDGAARVAVIKSNLSTFTTAPDAKLLQTERAVRQDQLIAGASVSQPLEFLSLLWECSVVNAGGFYLWYGLENDGALGLPDYLFQDSDVETLSILILIRPQDSNRTILAKPFHNVLVVTENLAADNPMVTVESAPHTIAADETLDTIAGHYGIDSGIHLAQINATLLNLLKPGERIPLEGVTDGYPIKPGDTLYTISKVLKVELKRVAAAVAGQARFLQVGTAIFIAKDWIYPRNKIPPGLAGFRLLRKNPQRPETGPGVLLGALAEDDVQERLELLFNLIGFRLNQNHGFDKTTEGLPIGPLIPPADSADRLAVEAGDRQPLIYQRLMKLAAYARNDAGHADVDGTDPYAGLGELAQIALQYHDIFGNKLLSDEQLPAAEFKHLYRDDIIGFGVWPAADLAYDLAGRIDRVALTAILAFNADSYVPGADQAMAAIVDKIHGDLDRYRSIFFQTLQPDVRIKLRCSFKPGAAESGNRIHYNHFALEAFKYLKTVQALRQITIPIREQATLAGIAAEFHIAVEDLAVVNAHNHQLIEADVTYLAPVFAVVLPGETVAELAARGSFSVEQFGTCNELAQLTQGLGIDLGAYGDYHIQSGDTLAKLAALAGAPPPAEIAARNQSLALFAQDSNVLTDLESRQTEPHDTLAAMAERAGVDIQVLAQFNQDQPIWRCDAVMVIPSHQAVGQYAGMTITIDAGESLADIARRCDLDAALIAAANINMVDVFQPGQTVYYRQADQPEKSVTVKSNDTLFTLTAALRRACADAHITPVQIALYKNNLNNPDLFLDSGQLLRPPQTVRLKMTISSEPKAVMTDLEVTISIERSDPDHIDPEFVQVEAVRCYEQELRPSLLKDENKAGKDLSLVNFAKRFETAFPNLRLAKGKKIFKGNGLSAADDKPPHSNLRLIGVHIDSDILRYRVIPKPCFFANTPLEREPWSAKNVPIKPYQGGDAVLQNFNNVDLNDWGGRFLAQLDDVLSDELASAVYSLDPDFHNRLAAAKAKIARAIADRVEPILKPDGQTQYDPDSAKERYYEQLLITLSAAYQHSALVQFPVEVTAPPEWGGEVAPRLLGRIVVSPYRLSAEDATLRLIADQFSAPVEAVALQSAHASNLLAVGNQITWRDRDYTIRAEDSLQSIADYYELSVEQMAGHFIDDKRLLRPCAFIDLIAMHYVFRVSDTLRSALDYLARQEENPPEDSLTLKVFALMNNQVKNIFNAGFELQSNEATYTVQAGDTLGIIADALGVDIPGLLRKYIAEPGLVRAEIEVSFLRRIAPASFAAAKIELKDTAASGAALYLNSIFSTSANFDLRNARLPLRFEVQALEYNIEDVSFHQSDGKSGYQSSDYLYFINRPPENDLGQVSIPIVKRNLPLAPVILGQATRKSDEQPKQVKDLTLYDYVLSYRYDCLPCDELEIEVEKNIHGDYKRGRFQGQLRDEDNLAYTLAQYSTMMEPLAADIALLRKDSAGQLSGELKTRAIHALTVFAELAERTASAWPAWRQSDRAVRGQRFRIRRHNGAGQNFTLSIEAIQGRADAQPALLEQIKLKPMGCALSAKSRLRSASIAADCYTASDEPTFEFYVHNISVIEYKNIWAKLKVVRNRFLDDTLETNQAFVLNVPDIRAVEPAVPLLVYELPFNAPRRSGRFDKRFSEFMRDLLYGYPGENTRRNIGLTASFTWPIAGEVEGQNRFWSREEKNAAVTTMVPVVTSNMGTVETDPYPEPFVFSKSLNEALDQWLTENHLPHRHYWSLAVRLYSDLGEATTLDQPLLLQLQDVRIPVADTGELDEPEEQ